MPSIKILVVEDFEGYRRFVCSALQRQVECQISEVSDGLGAIQKAQELRPDLILLDIGLPGLNGIEAGRRIREVSPDSKILYLSQESSAEIVQEALQLGALGYVFKADAADELLLAVDAVRKGRQFVSRRFAALGIGDTSKEYRDDHSRTQSHMPQEERKIDRFHEVGSHRNDASFVADFARFIERALRMGNPVIVVANESHRTQLVTELSARGWDVAVAIRKGRYTALDTGETLSTFMVNDWPDAAQLARVVRNLIREAKAGQAKHSRVAVCGECAPTLLAQGKAEAAIEVEHLWDQMARKYGLQLLCGYVLSGSVEKNSHIFQRICAEHSAAYSF